MKQSNSEVLQSLIGMNKDTAIKLLNECGYEARTIREDSESYMSSADLVFNRINLEVDKQIITHWSIG